MKEMRMVRFLENFDNSAKISVSDENGSIFYEGTVGDAPRSVWMHKNLVAAEYSTWANDFVIIVKDRPLCE